MALIEHPSDRYSDLITKFAPTWEPELRVNALARVIEGAPGNPVPALSEHIAARTPLTVSKVEPVVAEALAATPGDSTAKATAASQAVASAFPGVNVELSEAVMLNGTVRLCFAIGAGILTVACLVAVLAVGIESKPSEATIIVFSVIAILTLVAVLVLVMGYKTAKVKIGS